MCVFMCVLHLNVASHCMCVCVRVCPILMRLHIVVEAKSFKCCFYLNKLEWIGIYLCHPELYLILG
jgi:hypothetical protein